MYCEVKLPTLCGNSGRMCGIAIHIYALIRKTVFSSTIMPPKKNKFVNFAYNISNIGMT
jgi:hypothetical protein